MTAHAHIRLDDHGVAWIDDADVKVIEVVPRSAAYGLESGALGPGRGRRSRRRADHPYRHEGRVRRAPWPC
jgi:hypothetical protein